MVPWIRNPSELAAAFSSQRKALLASCASFDGGELWEAMRIATSVYVLLHDGGKRNRSLLTQIGKKKDVMFVASGPEVTGRNIAVDTPLVLTKYNPRTGAEYVPRLGFGAHEPRLLDFGKWWERDVIYRSDDKRLFRKKLVFAFRNLEGGSHFEKAVRDPNYVEMAQGETWVNESADGARRRVRALELMSIRQIGWEVLETLERARI